MKYNITDITNWIRGAFPVDKIIGFEAQFNCPKCGHESFYFNLKRSLGFCHRDSCHWNSLINLIGYSPSLANYVPVIDDVELPKNLKVELPEGTKPINYESSEGIALYHRGVLPRDVDKFNICASKYFIYIPVYEDGKLVQYVGRRINRKLPPKQWFDVPHKFR